MHTKTISVSRYFLAVGLVAVLIIAFAAVANATHSWGGYHWARTANPFTLKLGDNVSTGWDPYLATASADWSVSSVLDTTLVGGFARKNCRATSGRVEVCNGKYGANGWLGVASVWVSGSHITQGTVKLNDTYFNTATYNTPAWKNLVMCQEVAHTLGLDHQDEDFNNPPLGTCMDYSSDPALNQHPNAHDYEQLELIYAHLDANTTLSQTLPRGNSNIDLENPGEWGRALRNDAAGRPSVYARDLDSGEKVFTFVYWTDGAHE